VVDVSGLQSPARRVIGLGVLVSAAVLVFSATPAAAHGSGTRSTTTYLASNAPTPPGWKTYAYASALIAAPTNWSVERNDPCPSSKSPGLLVLGEPFGFNCPDDSTPAATVVLNTTVDAVGAPTSGQVEQRVHGVDVDIRRFEPGGESYLWAPSLGLSVAWSSSAARGLVATLRPLQPTTLSATCRLDALRVDLPALAKEIGASGFVVPSPSTIPVSGTEPGVSSDFDTDSPEFAALVTSGLDVFDRLISDPGPAAFYSSTVDPSRQVVLTTSGCRSKVAGLETLTASVSGHLLGPPWEMVAVTEPGWNGGAVFFRGDCPAGVQPLKTTAVCATEAVFFASGLPSPSAGTAPPAAPS
jgi:hypothetical protein